MGEKKSHVRKFLERHPICCFCGGRTPATTQDHWPSRSVFVGRKWPEGYVFPACLACNQISRMDEPLMALICRISFWERPGASEEWARILEGIKYSMPEVAASMLIGSVTEKRAAMRSHGLQVPAGSTARDFPMVSIAHPRFGQAARRFATKLFCSLYYHHTGRILGSGGRIFFVWKTNVDTADGLFDIPIAREVLAHTPELRRQNTSLEDQFFYRYNATTDDPPSAVFGATFNHAAAMIGIVLGDATQFTIPVPDDELLRPFSHPLHS